MLSGHGLTMQTSSGFDGRAFDFLTLCEDDLSTSEIDILRGQIIQALMIPPCIVMDDELPDALLELSGQVVVLEQDLVLQ